VTTRHGRSFDVAYGRYAHTYFVAFTETREMEIVPTKEITRISVGRRPTSSPRRPIGFSVERLDDGSQQSAVAR
jgi:hypothetical protein